LRRQHVGLAEFDVGRNHARPFGAGAEEPAPGADDARGVKGIAWNQKLHAVARAQIRSTRSRERSFEAVGHFNIDFKRRYLFAPLHPDHDFFRIEHDVPRDRGKDLCPQQFQQFRLAAQAAFMRQEYLQPFPCNRRGSSTATDEP
jgi:hypothetical protein